MSNEIELHAPSKQSGVFGIAFFHLLLCTENKQPVIFRYYTKNNFKEQTIDCYIFCQSINPFLKIDFEFDI